MDDGECVTDWIVNSQHPTRCVESWGAKVINFLFLFPGREAGGNLECIELWTHRATRYLRSTFTSCEPSSLQHHRSKSYDVLSWKNLLAGSHATALQNLVCISACLYKLCNCLESKIDWKTAQKTRSRRIVNRAERSTLAAEARIAAPEASYDCSL